VCSVVGTRTTRCPKYVKSSFASSRLVMGTPHINSIFFLYKIFEKFVVLVFLVAINCVFTLEYIYIRKLVIINHPTLVFWVAIFVVIGLLYGM
jgi:hypothetical protein